MAGVIAAFQVSHLAGAILVNPGFEMFKFGIVCRLPGRKDRGDASGRKAGGLREASNLFRDRQAATLAASASTKARFLRRSGGNP